MSHGTSMLLGIEHNLITKSLYCQDWHAELVHVGLAMHLSQFSVQILVVDTHYKGAGETRTSLSGRLHVSWWGNQNPMLVNLTVHQRNHSRPDIRPIPSAEVHAGIYLEHDPTNRPHMEATILRKVRSMSLLPTLQLICCAGLPLL